MQPKAVMVRFSPSEFIAFRPDAVSMVVAIKTDAIHHKISFVTHGKEGESPVRMDFPCVSERAACEAMRVVQYMDPMNPDLSVDGDPPGGMPDIQNLGIYADEQRLYE